MPERPKRRKNNKNKRNKNKNNRPDANKNNSDETKLDNSESCNTQDDIEEDCAESEVTETKDIKVEILQPLVDYQNTASSTSSDVIHLNGDLNNNSNQTVADALTIPVEKCQDVVPCILDTVDTKAYVVEAPERSHQSKAKLKSKIKSKSLDGDDATNITEITEDNTAEPGDENALALIDSQNVVVTHVESDVEWESTDDLNEIDITNPQELATGTLSVTTIPLNVAQCDQTKSLTPDEEKSLRTYLNTLNLATQPEGLTSIEMKTEIEEIINQEIKHRLRKKASADDFFLHRHGPPRMLDVIDEEGSGSGSSITSRRQSYLSDKRSDVEDLDDDVFEDKNKSLTQQKKMMSIAVHKKGYGQLVPQECFLVGAKIKEPEVSEARGDWTMKTVEKMTGAEVVYLTDTSSSTSSLHEIEDEDDDVDTDVSVRMITPTIEVTDTENFLKKTFISNAENNKQDISNESQQTKHDKINDNAENINVSEKSHEELKSKNINSDHNNKVQLEADQHSKIAKSAPIIAGTERIVEVIQDTTTQKAETKNNSQNLVRNETSNNEHIVKLTCDQGGIEKSSIPPTDKTNDKKNEHIINIEYGKRPEEPKSDVEKVSSQNSHEIVVLSTDNIKTNLYVKDIDELTNKNDKETQQSKFHLESKVIKCEFNDAINNLIKEVVSESEETNENAKDTFSRQDSSSSVDSSQCTEKYNPNYSSLNDISNMTHDETIVNNKINLEQLSSSTSHVKDIFECVTGTTAQTKAKSDDDTKEPLKLRDLCVRNIATLPYGKKILEELASVSERLQHIALYGTSSKTVNNKQQNVENMPHYRLPDVSSIETISIPTKAKDPIPPPIKPRRSSLNRKSSQEDEHWTGIPTKSEPVYVCLSPSQKMLMEKTNTVITKDDASHLVDMHRKYVDRRGYNEQYKNEKEREENEVDTTPIIPFKSQTGSRLLALIRDPTLTNTINSLNQRLNISSDEIQKKRTTTTFAKSNHDRFPSRDFSFKPIPPPRPKKYSSSFYESDESSDFTDSSMRSMKSERKFFHYSTGNLNKEIESDISSIQNMHRYFTDTRDEIRDYKCPRRPSLPKDLCEQQMEYIRQKEKEVEAEIQRLDALKNKIPQTQKQGPRAPLVSEKEVINETIRDSNNYSISRKKDVVMSNMTSQGAETRKAKLSAFSSSQEELLRDKMYSEYISQMAEREERKQHKVIKITNAPASTNHITLSKSMPTLDILDGKVNNRIEKEFISKARERWDKLGIKDPETEDERESANNVYKEPKVIEHKIKVIEGGKEKDVKKLPSHLQEFVRFTAKDSEQSRSSSAIWRPGAPPPVAGSAARSPGAPPLPPPPPVWTPGSAGASPQTPRKTFRPVHFEETPPSRRKFPNSEQNGCTSGSESEGRLRTSHSAPVTGLSTLGGSNLSSRLPKAQNPTVTLLQKAREGQFPRGSQYIQQEKDAARLPRDRPSPPRGDPVHALRKEYASEGEAERSDYERGGVRKMADAHRKVEGIGPITKDGMPVALRSEVKDPSRWYKKMYDTIHKNKYDNDYVTIRYKSSRGQPQERPLSNKSQYAYFDPRSGYLSEPEGGISRLGASTWSDAYDSDVTTGPRRRTASVQEDRRFCDVNSQYTPSTNKYSTLASARASHEVNRSQPGRIENYVPGKSSVVDKEAKQWWDEVMDIFDGWLDDNSPLPPYTTLLARAIQKSQNISSTTSLPQSSPKDKKDLTSTILSKSNMARALKESGYESDSTLVFRRRDDTEAPLSPAERRAAYRDLQAGGEPPLRGFRSPAPPRQDESEIEYIPISSTLTKIRVHKKTPKIHEVICYPITSIETGEQVRFKRLAPSFLSIDVPSKITDYPPAPPRRISSKNSRTLKLVTSTRPVSSSPKRTSTSYSQSNVDFLKDKINHKLSRQNTQIINKTGSATDKRCVIVDQKLPKSRIMSTSAPPAVNRKCNSTINLKSSMKTMGSESRIGGTSSFGSSRRMLLPTEYSNSVHSKYGEPHSSVVIEGGAGRKTPITNILDKVTSLDKLWSAEKRNERIDVTKVRAKSLSKDNTNKPIIIRPSATSSTKSLSPTSTHKSRDMIRTAERVQKLKISKQHTKSNPCLSSKNEQKVPKPSSLQLASSISKSSSNIASGLKKPNQVKTAVVTNLKKKKSLESVVIRPRSVPCHESCSKKAKDNAKNVNKIPKTKSSKKSSAKPNEESESGSQFGDTSNETSNFGSFENLGARRINSKDIKKSHDAIVSDTFFQHLFLGRASTPTLVYPMLEQNTTVLQKARMFQSLPQDNTSPKSLNTYLIHRKPVSLSRFKMWDRYPIPLRARSPRSVSWPGRMHDEIHKFDSLSKCDDFGSTSSLATIRSRSEPPCNKMYFSQTSRPKSPIVVFYKKEKPKETPAKSPMSPSRLVFTQTRRPISPKLVHRRQASPPQRKSLSPSKIVFTETVRPVSPMITRRSPHLEVMDSKSDNEKYPSTIFFSQTSRPVSPKIPRKSAMASVSRSHSTSPVSIRSPSYRRIHSARLQHSKQYADTIPKSMFRTRSAGDAERKILLDSFPMKTKSDSNLHAADPDYDEYVRDMQNTKMRSERFRELNRYYTYLERVAELEKATSTSDLRHRRKDEEIIDFDRWKKIRAIERAEEELNHLYRKLKLAQTEKDVLFYPRDLKDFRWNYDTDRGLRIKERSVEDLKDHFQQVPQYDSMELDQPQSRDSYKPLWRGTSVAETAFYINKKNDNDRLEQRVTVKPTVTLQQETSLNDLRKKIGLGSRLWSSLSMDQVNALKNQLNAIYSKELESKSNKEPEMKYTIDVKNDKIESNPSLHVRCNSLITSAYNPEREKPAKLTKSDSIAAISCPITSVKELKNNVNKIQMTLSENEKRKISQTLSKEILNRISKFDNQIQAPLSLKEEIENTEIKEQLMTERKDVVVQKTSEDSVMQANIDNIENDQKRHVVYTNEKTEAPCQSSASETETASSDISNKTAIYRGPSKEILKKVQYFESVKNTAEQTKTVYHARDSSDEKENQEQGSSNTAVAIKEVISSVNETKTNEPQKIVQSQSCTNFKELFGESERNKFLSLPLKPDLHSRSASPHSELYIADRRTPDTLRCSSDETIWRSRSPSPDPERYWRAYLNLARAGEVRRLARRFDSPTAAGAVLRRYRSDPELARNAFLSSWSSFEKLSSRRDKCRAVLPVARVPLRTKNRYMPHIDIISKLAALRRRTTPRSRSAEEALECRQGEVDRIRRRFETMSLLGQIYTSAPDVSELHDMAPYLAGSWIAHRYPKRSDNNRSLEDPNVLVRGRTSPVKKEIKRTVPKESIKLSSILKSDTFAKQEFNPAAHRPASRYEPPRAPPRPPPASWPYRLSPYVTPSRHTVTFQESDSAPEPPRRASHGSYSDTESPRRYVESDVNIHYRCPVRHDPLPLVPERELARQQAEHMKRLYREQKRNKYLQELQDMQNRRHQDNFTPSQKNILPLNRYDEAEKVIAKALYTFNGQTPRELSFRKGETLHVRRQIDNNWYEGELHGRIGLFPYNYVEIQKGDVVQAPKKPVVVEGRARAKFDFTAQTNLELPLKKGEVVVLTRRIDQNWWEGRNGTKTGIFPDSYVTILQEPSPSKPDPRPILNNDKPVASPAAHGLLNGSAKRSMGSHSYTPQQNSPALSNAPPATQPLPGYVAKPAQATLTPSERGYGPPTGAGVDLNNTEPLYVDTNAEAIPYRAMYKYRPQNPDELELNEGDTVYVLEKCDDGWYVGSSQRTGRFGTFPGNYVERI